MTVAKKKKEPPSQAETAIGDAENNDTNSVQRKKSGKKKLKTRPIKEETDAVSDIETSEAFKSSAEFSVSSSTRKGRVIGKRLPSARPGL